MTLPLVTAIVDTFNHEAFIEEALDSVLGQGLSPAELEVLVVDDGSTDRTPEILAKFGARARILRQKNGGRGRLSMPPFLSPRDKSSLFLMAMTGGQKTSCWPLPTFFAMILRLES